ncbi:MAG: VWA domain-containing protein [Chitinophagales bacterium]|nr:VWA domain-containing protein [Chitinophagales bacterium]
MLRGLFCWLAALWFCTAGAQTTPVYQPTVHRILFVVDASGSMREKWGGKTKFETACELLYKFIDSVERKNPRVEFAVRALGHQFHRSQQNCTDTRLLVPFAKNNSQHIRDALSRITPQGMTPIAYSLEQAISDFPEDARGLHAIVLITDGQENCRGEPCRIAGAFAARRIALRPFVVGMNIGQKFAEKLSCIGKVYDTQNDTSFYQTIGIIIRQTLHVTTTQVLLLDEAGMPTVTNVPFTLYDHHSGKPIYNFVHSLNEKGIPDTLYLDPTGLYDLEVHTMPPVRKEAIELAVGKHNLIAVDVPLAQLTADCPLSNFQNQDARVVVRNESREIVQVQPFNVTENYLRGAYRAEITTTPAVVSDTTLRGFADNRIAVPFYGTLSFNVAAPMLVSILHQERLVWRAAVKPGVHQIKLQPGKYRMVYKPETSRQSAATRTETFTITESLTTTLTPKL